MTRPTKELVDVALMVSRPGAARERDVACVLAAEVIALREELAALQSAPLFIEANESHRLASQPRYSIEAVDALLDFLSHVSPGGYYEHTDRAGNAMAEVVRASREPKLEWK